MHFILQGELIAFVPLNDNAIEAILLGSIEVVARGSLCVYVLTKR